MDSKKQKKQPNKYIVLTGIGLQMGVTIYAFVYIGKKLDALYPNQKNWFTIGLTLLGLVIALYAVVVQTNKLNN